MIYIHSTYIDKSASSYAYSRRLPEFLLPFSKSHLLVSPTLAIFPAAGLGEPDGSATFGLTPLGPRRLGDPYECLLPPFSGFASIAFCSSGLDVGENGDPPLLPCKQRPDIGEFE